MAKRRSGKKKDLDEVMDEERSRGTRRRPPDTDILQERSERLQDMWDLLRINNRKAFVEALTSQYGLSVQSAEYMRALAVWDQHHGRRRLP